MGTPQAEEDVKAEMKKKKHVLVFIDWYLPGYKAGGPIRSCANLLDHMSDDYDFSVVTRDCDYFESEPYKGVKSDEWNVMDNGTRVFYISAGKLNSGTIRSILAQEEYSTVYLNGIFSWYFTLLPAYSLRRRSDVKVVIAARGMMAESALAIKKIKKKVFLRSIKLLRLFSNVTFHATTPEEAKDIRRTIGDEAKIKVASNLPKKTGSMPSASRPKEKGKLRLVNIARIAPEKNLLYALEILKNFSHSNTKIIFDVFGPVYDQQYWTDCNILIDSMPENIKVNYRQSIESEKVPALLQNYHFMFMPTRGENFGHIILEAMSNACPVIISDQTPWKDLEKVNAGFSLSLTDPKFFIDVLARSCAMSQQEYDVFSAGAFAAGKAFATNMQLIEQNRDLFL